MNLKLGSIFLLGIGASIAASDARASGYGGGGAAFNKPVPAPASTPYNPAGSSATTINTYGWSCPQSTTGPNAYAADANGVITCNGPMGQTGTLNTLDYTTITPNPNSLPSLGASSGSSLGGGGNNLGAPYNPSYNPSTDITSVTSVGGFNSLLSGNGGTTIPGGSAASRPGSAKQLASPNTNNSGTSQNQTASNPPAATSPTTDPSAAGGTSATPSDTGSLGNFTSGVPSVPTIADPGALPTSIGQTTYSMGPDGKITANPGTSYQWNTNPDGSTSLTQKQNVQYADGSSGTISADLGVTSSAPGATSAAPGAVADTDPNSIPNPTNGGGNQNANVKYSTDSKGNTTCTDNSGRNIPCPSNKNSDQCSNSGMADAHGGGKGGYNTACSDAYSSVDTGQMVNTIGQAAGSITTTAAGQMAQAKAATASTQGASYAGAASTAEITGMNQLALGAANMYFGYKQYAASKAATAAATSATNDSAAKQKLVTQNQTAAKTATTAGQTDLATTYTNNAQTASKQMALFDAANPEETTAASKAKNGGIMSMVLGGLGIAGGGLELAAAQQYKNIANELNNINTAPALSIPADPFAQTPSAPAFAGTITGAGVASANPNYTPNPVPSGDLSGLVGPATGALPANALVAAAPSPGAFGANPSSGSGGGAGGGGLGGASTTDTKGDPEVQAKMAAQDRVNYEGGSASYGGGAAKSNAMGDKGTDLSSMLAALLPQKEEAQGPQNGILNYGNRSPASEGQYSYLDSRTNIFERVSNTYQDKTRQQKL